VISDINLDINGIPLNLRAIISISLLGRIIIEKSDNSTISFFRSRYSILIFIFFVYYLLETFGNNLGSFDVVKEFVTNFLSAFYGYYFFLQKKNHNILKLGLIFGALICIADLVYTYKFVGSFPPVHRLIDVYTGKIDSSEFTETNHNFFGYTCGICFVVLFNDYMQGIKQNKIQLLLLPVMLIGTLMSTSRAALSVLILVFIWVLIVSIRSSKAGARRVYKLGTTLFFAVCLVILFYGTFKAIFKVDSDIMDTLTNRLIDEPVAVINKHLGLNYDASVVGPMEWRKDANEVAYSVFLGLTPSEQIFGIGFGGFVFYDYGHGFNVHNGLFLLLIEGGMIGFIIYFTMIGLVFYKVNQLKLFPSSYVALVFIIIYTLTHNKEMTSATAFAFIGTLIAQIEYSKFNKYNKSKLIISEPQV
jgi:hypothetical protein